eukprot:CAMPEP_0185692604 /NCGR_PEP_ID=MMETSP1164-20130828/2650_1 /TAXON_ID=1104430 /ORGANISM="Chrysoreinhardia sp, Strain CCMP2950" /LENGTH=204 /DNA_ID=CAMNT_0028359343 /DNA_START=153 /DNA_END=765 /DNA_ORIENTATION=-
MPSHHRGRGADAATTKPRATRRAQPRWSVAVRPTRATRPRARANAPTRDDANDAEDDGRDDDRAHDGGAVDGRREVGVFALCSSVPGERRARPHRRHHSNSFSGGMRQRHDTHGGSRGDIIRPKSYATTDARVESSRVESSRGDLERRRVEPPRASADGARALLCERLVVVALGAPRVHDVGGTASGLAAAAPLVGAAGGLAAA